MLAWGTPRDNPNVQDPSWVPPKTHNNNKSKCLDSFLNTKPMKFHAKRKIKVIISQTLTLMSHFYRIHMKLRLYFNRKFSVVSDCLFFTCRPNFTELFSCMYENTTSQIIQVNTSHAFQSIKARVLSSS